MRESVEQKKQRIIESAIATFALKGNVTVRDITSETGINVASINYYFGGKENLLGEIERIFVERLDNMINSITEKKLSPQFAAKEFIEKAYIFIMENPGFFKFIGGAIIDQNVPYTLKHINHEVTEGPVSQFIYSIVSQATKIQNEKEIENRCMIFFASLALPVFQPQFAQKEGFIDYFQQVIQKDNFTSYMNTLMDVLLRP